MAECDAQSRRRERCCPQTGTLERSTAMEIDEASWIAARTGVRARPCELRSRGRCATRSAPARCARAFACLHRARLPGSSASREGSSAMPTAQLEAEGFLVIKSAPRLSSPRCAVPTPAASHREPRRPRPRYDLTPTTPDVTLFPLRRVARGVSERGAAEPRRRRSTTASPAANAPCARCSPTISAGRAGSSPIPQQIVVVQGTAQGVDLLLRCLKARGAKRIAVEDPVAHDASTSAFALSARVGRTTRRCRRASSSTGSTPTHSCSRLPTSSRPAAS